MTNMIFKKKRMVVILTSLGLILSIGFLLDYKKPHCVEAECAEVTPLLPIIEFPNSLIYDSANNGKDGYLDLGEMRDAHNMRRRICFFSFVYMENLDDDDEWSRCKLLQGRGDNHWWLEAHAKGDDNWVGCGAKCLCWPESKTDTWCEETKAPDVDHTPDEDPPEGQEPR